MLKTEKLCLVVWDSLLPGRDYSLQSYVRAWRTATLPTTEVTLSTKMSRKKIPVSVALYSFYSVLSLILFPTLERQEKESLFEKLLEKPNGQI